MLTGLIAIVVFVAALSAAFAYAIAKQMPRASLAKRAALAAGGGAVLPVLVPMVAVMGEGVIAPLAVLVVAVVLYLMVAFPIALMVSRKLDAGKVPPRSPDTFD